MTKRASASVLCESFGATWLVPFAPLSLSTSSPITTVPRGLLSQRPCSSEPPGPVTLRVSGKTRRYPSLVPTTGEGNLPDMEVVIRLVSSERVVSDQVYRSSDERVSAAAGGTLVNSEGEWKLFSR